MVQDDARGFGAAEDPARKALLPADAQPSTPQLSEEKQAEDDCLTGPELSGRSAQIRLGTPNIYVAVLVGAFGGVRAETSPGVFCKVHPLPLLLLSVPVFLAQVSILFYLRVASVQDADMVKLLHRLEEVHSEETREAFLAAMKRDGHDFEPPLLNLKLLMVVIVYVMNFQCLLVAFQQVAFVLNPITWIEVAHPAPSDWIGHRPRLHWLFTVYFKVLVVIAGLGMNLLVSYIVCTDSVSVILLAGCAQDVIFNSLAITFIVDLASSWFEFCSDVFHLEPIDDFDFVLLNPEAIWAPDANEPTAACRRRLLFPTFIQGLLRWTTLGTKCSVLRHSHGAHRVIQLSSVLLLAGVFLRQLFIVLRALDTNFAPVVYDFCTTLTWQFQNTPTRLLWNMFEHSLYVDLDGLLNQHEDLWQECVLYMRPIGSGEMWQLLQLYPRAVFVFAVSLLIILIVPALWQNLHSCFRTGTFEYQSQQDAEDARQDDRIDELTRLVNDLVERLREQQLQHQGEMRKLQDQLQRLQEGTAQQ